MKRLLLAFLILCALPCFADERAQGFCMVGGQKSITQGLQSTNDIMASYPQCQVNVYLSGTTTPASIFSDNGVTPLTNPFTANTDASWAFYAADGHYDIVLSGGQAGGFPVPFTLSYVFLNSGGGGGSSVTVEVNGIVVPPAVYNFINGTNTVISNPQNGDIRIDSTGGGVCGSNFIPCLNTPNTWLTGIQKFLSSGVNDIPIVVHSAAGGVGTPVFVQGTVTQVSGPFFGCAITLNGVAPGDAIIAVGFTNSSGGVTPATISDNQGDSYTQVGFDAGKGGASQTVFVAPNAIGGNTTVSMDQTGEVSNCLVIEYAGLATSPVDGITFGSSSSTSLPLGPVTTTNPTDVILTVMTAAATTGVIQPGGYTLNAFGTSPGGGNDYAGALVVNSAGSYSGAWTNIGTGGNGFIMGLKVGGSGLYQNSDLQQFQDAASDVMSSVNAEGQFVLHSYIGGPGNIPSGPALAYNSTTNCPVYYNLGTHAWTTLCSGGGGTPGGSSGSIQVNNSGAFGGATSPQIVTALNVSPSSTFAPALLPLATSSAFGAIKPDNVSCSVSAGILACTGSGGGITTLTGDVTASGSGSVATTLATVNSSPGSCGDATHVCAVTTNGKGLVTAQSAVAITGIGSVAFSAITGSTNTTAAMLVGTGASLGATGSGSITATAMPYTGLTGSVPTWNQNTTGTAGGLSGAPAITVASVTANNLTPGNCLQAATGHIIVDTGVPCGSGGGGGSGITALTGDVNASGIGSVPAVVKGINGVILGALTTGLLKNATTTGVPSIAVAGTDYLTPAGNGSGLTALNASNLGSGTVPAARLPNPSATTLGGVQSKVAVASQWINAISTLGVPSSSQPAFSNISGTVAVGQLPLASNSAFGIVKCDGTTTTCPGGVISATAGLSGLSTGFLSKATSGTSIGNSLIDEGVTRGNTATVSDPGGLDVAGTGASIIGFGGPGVTITKAAAATSAICVSSCLTARGSFTVAAGSVTVGTLATVSFSSPLPTTAPVCGVSESGGTSFIGLGHGTPTTSGFTVTAAVSAAGQSFTVDYWCSR